MWDDLVKITRSTRERGTKTISENKVNTYVFQDSIAMGVQKVNTT